jgi:uncharacterized protein YodC (DUF2158 family)
MSNRFKIGDRVRHRSGAPTMNPIMVVKNIGREKITCTWSLYHLGGKK